MQFCTWRKNFLNLLWQAVLHFHADYNFFINCGGPQISSSDIAYEWDNETLGPATYYVTENMRWAVSNVGYFAESDNPQYKSSTSFQITNTSDVRLFQTARISASSLRYYGLGLENGNYTVSLQFAETAFQGSFRWNTLGTRLFDIYIQVCVISLNYFETVLTVSCTEIFGQYTPCYHTSWLWFVSFNNHLSQVLLLLSYL